MFRSFIISAFRNLIKNKAQSIIQILSLALGLTIFTMVMLYLYDELSVDRSNPNFHQIYRIEQGENGRSYFIHAPIGPVILDNIPDITQMTRINHYYDVWMTAKERNGPHEKHILLHDWTGVDSSFQNVFPQKYLLGDPRTALKIPGSVVLTETVAEKLYGSEDPIGKIVVVWGDQMMVTGVIKDPLNTHLKFEALFPIETIPVREARMERGRTFFDMWCPTYIILHKFAESKEVEEKIDDTWIKFGGKEYNWTEDWDPEVTLRPLKDVHYSETYRMELYMTVVQKKELMNFFMLGLVILILGIINYVNLSTSRETTRSREIAIKKITGSSKLQLIRYFLTESVITSFLSFLLAVICLLLIFPKFNQLLQADINLYFLGSPLAWLIVLLTIVFIGIISGLYPAISLSSSSPLIAIKGNLESRGMGVITRRVLLIIQFSMAVILMIGSFIIYLQIRYMKEQDLGFTTKNVVWKYFGGTPERKLRILSRLVSLPEIENACLSQRVPGAIGAESDAPIDDPESIWNGINLEVFAASPEFFKVYGVPLIYGQEILDNTSFTRIAKDSSEKFVSYCVINESCRKALKLEDPVGYRLQDNFYIAGVCEDFHIRSLKSPVKPLLIPILSPGEGDKLSLKIKSHDINKALRKIEKKMHEYRSEISSDQNSVAPPINFYFIDETYNKQYDQVERVYDASVYFFIIAIILASLGLFGLSTFMARRRTREIAIRKTMGASEIQIIMLLIKDFIKWVALSILIGCSIGWYLIYKWQQQFYYKVNIEIWVYVIIALIAAGIAFLTMAWQTIKTARTNPSETLRYE